MTNSDEIWYTVSRINLLQQDVNVFHITWIMSLYTTLWNLKCSSRRCYHCVVMQRKKLQNLSNLIWGLRSPDSNPVDYSVWEYCKSRCTKHASLIWTNWSSDWEWSGPGWITSSLRQPFTSSIVNSSRSVMHVLYIFSYNIVTRCSQLDLNIANLEATVEVGKIPEFLSLYQRNGNMCPVSILSFLILTR